MKRRSTSSDPRGARLRARVAAEAARLVARDGLEIAAARREAAEALGARHATEMPDAAQIREELQRYRALFTPGALDPARLRRQREAALEAMAFFGAFEPRLAGPVLDGSAGPDDPVQLHLHADDPDAVARLLHDRGAPARQRSAALKLADGRWAQVPCWDIGAGGQAFELWVLPAAAARHAPRDALGEGALPRAGAAALRRLLEAGEPGP